MQNRIALVVLTVSISKNKWRRFLHELARVVESRFNMCSTIGTNCPRYIKNVPVLETFMFVSNTGTKKEKNLSIYLVRLVHLQLMLVKGNLVFRQ